MRTAVTGRTRFPIDRGKLMTAISCKPASTIEAWGSPNSISALCIFWSVSTSDAILTGTRASNCGRTEDSI